VAATLAAPAQAQRAGVMQLVAATPVGAAQAAEALAMLSRPKLEPLHPRPAQALRAAQAPVAKVASHPSRAMKQTPERSGDSR
jgi:hypothetical protein